MLNDAPRPPIPFSARADMKDHPDCRYSLSSQKECSSTNGNFACETIRRVFRNCPGLRPEQVYDITTRDTGTVPKPPDGGDGGDGGIPIFGGRASQQPVRPGSKQRCLVEASATLTTSGSYGGFYHVRGHQARGA